ncbi:TPR protein [Salix suchowensis]|nr:TPR protein [Salix suchowensis]
MASPELSSLARSKLHSSVSGRESCNLHRWVLLKNSYIHSTCIPSTAARTADTTPVNIPNPGSEDVEEDDDDDDMEVGDSFMFPDAGKLAETRSSDINSPESQWLDSVLEGLGGDDDDEDYTTIASIRVSDTDLPALRTKSYCLAPCPPPHPRRPAWRSLIIFSRFHSCNISIHQPLPHFHPPLVHPYHFESTMHSSLSSIPRPYEDPLPYYDIDDVENLSVPDAIEDTSDDESDAPSTPSLGSRSSLVDPAGIPLPGENVRRPRSHPHVYIDNQDSYFYPFELEPLPFSDDHTPHQPRTVLIRSARVSTNDTIPSDGIRSRPTRPRSYIYAAGEWSPSPDVTVTLANSVNQVGSGMASQGTN